MVKTVKITQKLIFNVIQNYHNRQNNLFQRAKICKIKLLKWSEQPKLIQRLVKPNKMDTIKARIAKIAKINGKITNIIFKHGQIGQNSQKYHLD